MQELWRVLLMTEFQFIIAVAHILTCESLSGQEKLDCIKIRYRQYAFPEKERISLDKLSEYEYMEVCYAYFCGDEKILKEGNK
jgi:hypothetical protein